MFKIEKNFSEESLFKIESNIPVQRKKRILSFPFEKMSVGDSFLVPTGFKGMNKVSGACSYSNKVLAPKRFMARTTEEGIRVWRVA